MLPPSARPAHMRLLEGSMVDQGDIRVCLLREEMAGVGGIRRIRGRVETSTRGVGAAHRIIIGIVNYFCHRGVGRSGVLME